MATGLQVFNDAGVVVLDTSNRIAKVLGSISVNNNGSVYVPLLVGNEPFFFVYANQAPDLSTGGLPNVNYSGGTISWVYPGAVLGVVLSCTIIYGMY